MKWHDRSYWISKSSIISQLSASLLWIVFISHQTRCTRNATYINYHFGSLTFLDDKMIKEKHNNDFNLSGDTTKWHINEQIFHILDIQLPVYVELAHDPICILLYSTSNFLRCRNDKICNPQWFQFEWRRLKMRQKWDFNHTPNILLPQYIRHTNSPLGIL